MTDKAPIRVVVAADFSDEIMDELRDLSDQLVIERHFPNVPDAAFAEAEVLYTIFNFPKPEQAPHLRWIQLHYAGMEKAMEQPIVQAEDVDVTSASGIHATQMAEYSIAMMLAFMYRLPKVMSLQAEATWPEKPHEVFKPAGLRGQVLGIVGYGSIGRELARIADAMGMSVLATKRDLKTLIDEEGYAEVGTGDPTADIPERLYPPEALASMARECDYLVITVPLTDATHHMVDETVLKAMKKTGVLINVARGAVVDEAALISALAAEKIGGAALDVFEKEPLPASSPLWNLDNVIITPHISGNTTIYHQKAAALFMENLRRYVEKRPLLNLLKREHGY